MLLPILGQYHVRLGMLKPKNTVIYAFKLLCPTQYQTHVIGYTDEHLSEGRNKTKDFRPRTKLLNCCVIGHHLVSLMNCLILLANVILSCSTGLFFVLILLALNFLSKFPKAEVYQQCLGHPAFWTSFSKSYLVKIYAY